MISKKAQVGMEFIIILSVVIVIFLALWQTIGKDRFEERVHTEIDLDAKTQAEKIYFAITAMHYAGDGTNMTTYLEDYLGHQTRYNLTVYNEGFVVVDYLGRNLKMVLPTKNVTDITLSGTVVVIRNEGGVTFA
jgi:uncharacterized protein (UPF0333 family)